jgi:hypothetical protein
VLSSDGLLPYRTMDDDVVDKRLSWLFIEPIDAPR